MTGVTAVENDNDSVRSDLDPEMLDPPCEGRPCCAEEPLWVATDG